MSGSVHVNNPAVRQFYFTPYNPHLTRYDNSRNILICLEGQLLGKTVYTQTHTHTRTGWMMSPHTALQQSPTLTAVLKGTLWMEVRAFYHPQFSHVVR